MARSGLVRPLTASLGPLGVAPGRQPDGRALVVSSDEIGQRSLYVVDPKTGAPRKIVGDGEVEDFGVSQDRVLFTHASLAAAAELYSVGAQRRPAAAADARSTRPNLARGSLGEYEQFTFKGWQR